ncbi:MAG TPA: hypothetical protein IGS37_10825 [Synechococcales cyanobacterium M55_K2018_004]|nr:hypothetical protein [Synechococcales cyanobacterium M55_K2018_004]
MTPLMLRQLWSLVDDTQSSLLLNLDDSSLVQWLAGQFYRGRLLNHSEFNTLSDYIRSHLPLIRELAENRC